MRHDFIALIHEYGYNNIGKQPHMSELYKFLFDNGVTRDDVMIRSEIDSVITDCFYISTNDDLLFKSDAYYRHIDYLQLLEGRANTKNANHNSLIALSVSVVLAVIQIVIGYLQYARN